MTKKRKMEDPLPAPGEIERLVRGLILDAADIPRHYRKAYELGLDPRGGSEVHVNAGPSDYVPDAAIENKRAAAWRAFCREVAREVVDSVNACGNARTKLRKQIEPGFRQPPRDRAHAVVDDQQWHESLEQAAARARRGEA